LAKRQQVQRVQGLHVVAGQCCGKAHDALLSAGGHGQRGARDAAGRCGVRRPARSPAARPGAPAAHRWCPSSGRDARPLPQRRSSHALLRSCPARRGPHPSAPAGSRSAGPGRRGDRGEARGSCAPSKESVRATIRCCAWRRRFWRYARTASAGASASAASTPPAC
jgi:hypothetical protein